MTFVRIKGHTQKRTKGTHKREQKLRNFPLVSCVGGKSCTLKHFRECNRFVPGFTNYTVDLQQAANQGRKSVRLLLITLCQHLSQLTCTGHNPNIQRMNVRNSGQLFSSTSSRCDQGQHSGHTYPGGKDKKKVKLISLCLKE